MALPPLNLSLANSSGAGPGTAHGMFDGGTINFGGSGMGGGAVGNGLNLGTLVSQYWPLLAVVGVVWYMRRKRA